MTSTKQTPMTPARNLANDLLITACEGGINYWALLYEYELPGQFVDGWAFIIDNESEVAEFNFLGHVLNRDEITERIENEGTLSYLELRPHKIELTVRRLANGDYKEELPTRWQIKALEWLDNPTDADYDAEDADVVAQLTLFGKVVYA